MLIRITGPVGFPVTLEDAKAHLNVDHGADDPLITSLIGAATEHLESLLGRKLLTQRWELRLARFPRGAIEVPLPPCREIIGITYLDRDEDEQTLDLSSVRVSGLGTMEGALVEARLSSPWPATATHPEAVRLRFDAGFGGAADVPTPLKTAILQHVASLYQTREAAYVGPANIEAVPQGYLDIIAPFQAWRF